MKMLNFPKPASSTEVEDLRRFIADEKEAVGIVFLDRSLTAIRHVEQNAWLNGPIAKVIWVNDDIRNAFHIKTTPTIHFCFRGDVCFRRYEYLAELKFRNLLLMSEVRVQWDDQESQEPS